ncbi:MAG: hypothetical protein FVQ83_13500 [Chloroflexi bacterium]|nr:hypothetical protein [Chloroflexota bacterium]
MNALALAVLIFTNQLLEAGIAISSLSLFLRSLTFNLRDRVSRTFAIILACVVFIFSGEALSGVVSGSIELEFWLRFQWIGIILLPAAYLNFSDALLATTGRVSRGRRRIAVRLTYGMSGVFLIALASSRLVGPVVVNGEPLPYLERTVLSAFFTLYYISIMLVSGLLLYRAYNRTVLSASRRRMGLLLSGSFALAIGSYPFILLGSELAENLPVIFLSLATVGNVLVIVSLLAMAYAAAFFGVSWPDRLVKSRLFKWLLRGPVTVFIVLLLSSTITRVGILFSSSLNVLVTIITVSTVLLMEHIITIAAPIWERWLFHGGDRENLRLVQTLEERLVTTGDLRQFLEVVLAAVCDQFQVSTGFVAALDKGGLELVVRVGKEELFSEQDLSENLLKAVVGQNGQKSLFSWGNFWLLPLFSSQQVDLLGLLGVLRDAEGYIDEEQVKALDVLGQRAVLALEDRRLQRQVFLALEALNPKVELIQRLRAASRYDQREMLMDLDTLPGPIDLAGMVKDALSHYWGGPKLTKSPLLRLQIVQQALNENDGNPANALRAVLRQAIERIRPEGDRRFTADWILYNILELKFMQGRKVREVAMRLAVSEADLYRKQRVAFETIAESIITMERAARKS